MTTYKFVNFFKNRHHGGTRPLSAIKGIVLHYTYGFNGGDKSILLNGTGRGVSVHYFVADDNDKGATSTDKSSIYRCLPLKIIGWSVGTCINGWGNSDTVSAEVGNRGNEMPTLIQLEKVTALIKDVDHQLGRKVPIKGHSDIALPKGRKNNDPGKNFPLDMYKKYRQHYKPATTKVVPKVIKKVTSLLKAAQGQVKHGSHNHSVKILQQELNKRGFHCGLADGKFGDDTEAALVRYQKSRKLPKDGVCGRATWKELGFRFKK